jgi:hypothetical protein
MLKSLVVIAALAVAAPGLAVAADNQPNTPPGQTLTGPPPFGNDPPPGNFNGRPTLPMVFGTFPGCYDDKDDRNGLNGDDKNPGHGNPHCQPASP